MAKSAIDKDLKRVQQLRAAAQETSRAMAAPGIALVFLLARADLGGVCGLRSGPLGYLVIIATVIAAYMALNIGANDVANNMGPAVGAKALTMGGALADRRDLRSGRGASGGRGRGHDHLARSHHARHRTEHQGLHHDHDGGASVLGALDQLATMIGAPVSTTHSVIGGRDRARRLRLPGYRSSLADDGAIAASWVISPAAGRPDGRRVCWLLINVTILGQGRKDGRPPRSGCRCWSR